jgi:hypothetical protein
MFFLTALITFFLTGPFDADGHLAKIFSNASVRAW